MRQGISSVPPRNFYSLPNSQFSLLQRVLELYSRELGGEGNPPLLVLHGMLGSSRNWLSAGKALAENWHVHALDLRNHGQSPHGESMDYVELVADVIAWMDRRDITRADFIGHSMGGKVAMCIATRHPERIRRLVAVDIAPKSYRSAQGRPEFEAMHELDLSTLKSRTEAEQQMESRVSDWAMRKFLTTNLARTEDGGWRWAINLRGLTAALPVLEEDPLADNEFFAGPTLFVLGGNSRYVLPEDHEGIRTHFPNVEIKVIPESGHNPHMQSREAFTGMIASWAGSVG